MKNPKNILLLMCHSAGIGDILRGSASWRAIKNKFPETNLHLLFLTKDKGYVSEKLIAKHHLLSSFQVIDERIKTVGDWIRFIKEFDQVLKEVKPDFIIDLEPHGLKTSLLCLYARIKYKIKSLGIDEIPLRGLFYSMSSPSSRKILKSPDYTDRYFVALKALGIERKGIPIELEETEEAIKFRESFRQRFGIPEDAKLIGLNIGCGTPDALWKRPNLGLLRNLVETIQKNTDTVLVLTGATFEKDINEEFLRDYNLPAYDLAGATDILELPGLIRACRLFISTDSGPYHMAVALKVPTLAIFVKDFPPSYHKHPWVRCVVLGKEEDVKVAIEAGMELYKAYN
ncbi:MAG: glycosyltransferase family 9 protein [Aquificaceae bacterium]